ncbi:MAG: Fur family transcriptional regulator [Bacillota bacterium]|nr:Fur family transcriptional regulator [Bacillota bacterium]
MADTAFVDKAKQTLRNDGYKLTGPRLAILEFMLESERPYSMKEICCGLQKKFSGIGTATVYRNVNLFLKLGIFRTSPVNNNQFYYTINRPRDEHHHMICLQCGTRVEFNGCNFDLIAKEIEKNTHFEIYDHTLEVYGLCPGCLAKRKDYACDREAD